MAGDRQVYFNRFGRVDFSPMTKVSRFAPAPDFSDPSVQPPQRVAILCIRRLAKTRT